MRRHLGICLASVLAGSAFATTPQQEIARRPDCKIHAKFSKARGAVSSFVRAIEAYRDAFGKFPERLEQLGPPPKHNQPSPEAADLVGKESLDAGKYGYSTRYERVAIGWHLWMTPVNPAKEGCGSFYVAGSRTIHARWEQGEASDKDPLLIQKHVAEKQQEAFRTKYVKPRRPELARLAQIHGAVRMEILIDVTGSVAEAEVISGHPLLVEAALDAVRQWQYKPTVVNGVTAEVRTTVTIFFPVVD